jgi:hypothetical protein
MGAFGKYYQGIVPVMQHLYGFIKYFIIPSYIFKSVTDPVNRHDVQVRQKSDEPFSLKNVRPGQKNILEWSFTNQQHGIHQGILMVGSKNDRLVSGYLIQV